MRVERSMYVVGLQRTLLPAGVTTPGSFKRRLGQAQAVPVVLSNCGSAVQSWADFCHACQVCARRTPQDKYLSGVSSLACVDAHVAVTVTYALPMERVM